MEIGIDKIGMYTPNQYVDLVELAIHRKIDPDKFTIGIGRIKWLWHPYLKIPSPWPPMQPPKF